MIVLETTAFCKAHQTINDGIMKKGSVERNFSDEAMMTIGVNEIPGEGRRDQGPTEGNYCLHRLIA